MIITISINFFMVFICTVVISLLKYNMDHEKFSKSLLLFSLITGLTGSSFASYLVLQESEMINYMQHLGYILADMAGIIIFCSIFLFKQRKSEQNRLYFWCILIYMLVLICVGIRKYNEYHNVKSAIYDILLPKTLCIAGGIVVFTELIITFLMNYKKYVKTYRHDFFKKQVIIWNLIVTVLLYPFFETFFSNLKEFHFSAGDIACYVLLIVISIWILLNMLLLFEGKQSEPIICGMTVFALCSYIQGMFLNNYLFLMDGKKMEWSVQLLTGNILVWLGIIIFTCVILQKNKQRMVNIMFGVSGIMLAMQLAGGVSVCVTTDVAADKAVKHDYFSNEGLYTAAENTNVYVFVLDTFDVDYWNQIIEEEPDFAEPMEGFIFYPDTVSQFSRTYPSIPYMLSEQLYFYEIPQQEYNQNAVSSCKIWNELLDNNYNLYFYEESQEYIGDEIRYKAKNYVAEGKEISKNVSLSGTLQSMMKISGYRIMPYFIKTNYLYTSEMVNSAIITEVRYDRPVFNPLDGIVYQEFQNSLEISNETKAFKFIHLNGAHAPYYMDENCKIVDSGNTSLIEQCKGSMKLVYRYLSELKRLGLYENSLIIITADHGENYVTKMLEQNTNPILFIKPMNNSTESMKISDVYASQNDILPTIASQLNLEYDEKWGIDLLNTNGKDKNRKRYHYYAVVENTLQTKDRTYEIEGSSLDFNNWRATDEYHEFLYY